MSDNDKTPAKLPTQRIGARLPHPGFVFAQMEQFESRRPDPNAASAEAVKRLIDLLRDTKIDLNFFGLMPDDRPNLLDPSLRRRVVVVNVPLPHADVGTTY